jgi:hypothetical protein
MTELGEGGVIHAKGGGDGGVIGHRRSPLATAKIYPGDLVELIERDEGAVDALPVGVVALETGALLYANEARPFHGATIVVAFPVTGRVAVGKFRVVRRSAARPSTAFDTDVRIGDVVEVVSVNEAATDAWWFNGRNWRAELAQSKTMRVSAGSRLLRSPRSPRARGGSRRRATAGDSWRGRSTRCRASSMSCRFAGSRSSAAALACSALATSASASASATFQVSRGAVQHERHKAKAQQGPVQLSGAAPNRTPELRRDDGSAMAPGAGVRQVVWASPRGDR